jgi:3-dehydroquinate synthase
MPSFPVRTRSAAYDAIVERGVVRRTFEFLPESARKLFVVTSADVWEHHGDRLRTGLQQRNHTVLLFPGGEERKRLSSVEALADQMVAAGGDRTSFVIAFGGGIVNDVGGFLAAVFMRGVPVLQIPTTLLAQVDAAVGGKTGVNLTAGKNLVGSFHQPRAVLIDPEVLSTLSDREYRAGLYEIIKCGVIRSPKLFQLLAQRADDVLARVPGVVDEIIAESVRIKAEVVTADERESDLRRILNFGHTVGHALEAETGYSRFLHGEAVAFGMRAATHLAAIAHILGKEDEEEIVRIVNRYGPIPSLQGIAAESLVGRLKSDKKTVHGTVHFVLPSRIGEVRIVSNLDEQQVLEAVGTALR